MFAGTIAGSSAPALVDAQATEDKYGHDDYGKDKYGQEDKYSTYGKDKYGQDDYGKDKYGQDDYGKDRDDKYGHDDKSSVKYIKCNNVNINGKERNHNGGNQMGGGHEWPRDGGNEWFGNSGNEWPRGGGEENEMNYDSYMKRDNHNFPGFIKQTDKDVVVICIFNNDGKKDNEPKTPEEKCERCIEDLPGLSPGQNPQQPNGTGLERDFIEFLIDDLSPLGEQLTPAEAIAEFCEMLTGGDISEADLLDIIEMALPPNAPANPVEELFECLSALIPDMMVP
jgi:hypothetical protein